MAEVNKKLAALNAKFDADLYEAKAELYFEQQAQADTGCPHCGSYEGDATECPECGHGQ